MGTELPQEKIGPSIVGRLKGGMAQEWAENVADLSKITEKGGKAYIIQELAASYLRPDFERIFVQLMTWTTHSVSKTKELEGVNKYEHYIQTWIGLKNDLISAAAGEADKAPERIRSLS